MEKTGCKIICGAPTTLAVKGLMMMMMRFRCVMPKGKRKNRSADVSNISNNSSVGNTTVLSIRKRARVHSTSNKQSTLLLGFVDQQRRPPQGQGTIKTVTADSDENHRVDSCSLKDQL